jgi:methionyl-tRNA formyltransferase
MKKQVGIIVDSTSVSKQLGDLISLSKQSNNYEITTLIINIIEHKKQNIFSQIYSYILRRGLKKFVNNALFRVICKLESYVLKRSSKYHNFYSKVKLNDEEFSTIYVKPNISQSGLVYRYDEEDIKRIKELNLDLLIRGGGGILRSDILNVCSNGVISFHHADNDINRGGPPGFWEVYERNPRTGFIIQRLNNELDGGDVLYKGFVSTSWFYSLNLAKLYEVANPFFHQVLEDITSERKKLSVYVKKPYSHTLYTTPSVFQTLAYIVKTARVLVLKISRKLQGKSFRWGVAYQFSDKWDDITLWRSKKIPNPKNRFLADPFVIKKNGSHYCFVEDLDYTTNRGSISAYKITSSSCDSLGVVLEEDFHLSFPFIFEYQNELYMCPETHEKGEIRLYKSIDFPTKWEFQKTIMNDVSAADTIIFKRDNLWWLFTNIDKSGVGDHGCQLHIFSADSPLSDKWVAHENNPVIFNPLVARNGGLIVSQNEIYRIYQRQGFDMYGEACGIARITSLTPTEYVEDIHSEIKPHFFNGIKGTHTYNFDSDLVVFDYVEVSKKATGT